MERSTSPIWETSEFEQFNKTASLPVGAKPKQRSTPATFMPPQRSLVSPGSLPSGLSSYEVACPTSQELYVFDVNGTHQFTMSLVTGDYMYNFSYRLVVGVFKGQASLKYMAHTRYIYEDVYVYI